MCVQVCYYVVDTGEAILIAILRYCSVATAMKRGHDTLCSVMGLCVVCGEVCVRVWYV